jgi:hypothetical protein
VLGSRGDPGLHPPPRAGPRSTTPTGCSGRRGGSCSRSRRAPEYYHKPSRACSTSIPYAQSHPTRTAGRSRSGSSARDVGDATPARRSANSEHGPVMHELKSMRPASNRSAGRPRRG